MNSNAYPLRFRLAGERTVHAVRFVPGKQPFAACGEGVMEGDARQDERTRVSCGPCKAALNLST